MRAAGLICDLRCLKFVHLSERKGVCGANALNFIILSVKNTLNLGILAFLKALSTKSVVNSACGVAWQSVLLGRSGAWQNIANSVWRVFVGKTTHDKFGLASVAKVGGACGRNRRSENGAVFGRRTSLSLSLSR